MPERVLDDYICTVATTKQTHGAVHVYMRYKTDVVFHLCHVLNVEGPGRIKACARESWRWNTTIL